MLRFPIPTGLLWLFFLPTMLSAQSISKRGYPEHFIVGSIIAGGVANFLFKKTKKRMLSWVVGVLIAALAGFLKEVVDSTLLHKMSNWNDFNYTWLGGIAGASLAVPIRKSGKVKPFGV